MSIKKSARRIAAAACSCVLALLLSVGSFADQSYSPVLGSPIMFFHDYSNLFIIDGYPIYLPFSYNYQTQLYNLSLDLYEDDVNLLLSQCVGIGTRFDPGSTGFEEYATYQFTISFVLGASASLDVFFDQPSSYSPFNCMGAFSLDSYGLPLISDSIPIAGSEADESLVYENGVYTFTAKNISWERVKTLHYIFLSFPFTYIVFNTSDPAYMDILNTYFGLESSFDEVVYKKTVAEKLDAIQGSLDDIQDGISDVGDKVDQAGDKISGELDELQQDIQTQHIKEEEYAEQKGNDNISASEDAINDSGLIPNPASIWDGIGKLIDCVSNENTVKYIDVPEVKIPSLTVSGAALPEVVIIPKQQLDFSEILENEHMQTLIGVARVFYYVFFAIFIIDYCRKLIDKITLRGSELSDAYNREVTKGSG